MRGLVVFGGTTEGRRLSRALAAAGVPVTVSVATAYGAALEGAAEGLTVRTGRLEADGMAALLAGAALCVDATHPYARLASANIRAACRMAGVRCLRLLRPASPLPPDALTAADAAGAARLLAGTEGRVLLATGAKELDAFAALAGSGRLYARVLPACAALEACRAAGIPAGNIVAMQGPFSRELNAALLRQFGIRWLVTKDGGAEGGFAEKAAAAADAGARLVVIRRPAEEGGLGYEEAFRICLEVARHD